MILDQLDLCPFCLTKLYINPNFHFKVLACPKKDLHPLKQIWAYYYESDKDFTTISPHKITSLNIVYNNYQFHFFYEINLTRLLHIIDEEKSEKIEIIQFPYMLDFILTEETIDNKIKTILTLK
jgi:hypothetical protein